jgi:intraflagellar transport protein 172
MLVQKGEWEECLSLASKQGSDVLNSYLQRYAKLLLQEGHFKDAAKTFHKYSCPTQQSLLPFYKTIALEILAGSNDGELQVLRDMLQKVNENLSLQMDKGNPVYVEFYQYLLVSHLLLLKSQCLRQQGLGKVYMKICISLLRYTKEIRADKAFIDSGNACRKEKVYNMAFVFLNRYLDLAEAIDDPEGAALADNTDFADTDLPSPYDIPLPEKNLLSEHEREEIRDWVLQMSVDSKIEQSLTTRCCDFCGTDIYEASLSCPKCQHTWEPCIITGYPLVKNQHITCKFCDKGALREDWNEYISVTQHCPWCKSIQTPY